MKHTHDIAIFLVLVFVTQLGFPTLHAQTIKPIAGSWTLVEALQPGQSVEITLDSGGSIRGKFNGLTSDNIILARGNGLVETARSRIRKVFRVGGKQIGKSTLIGLGVGTAAGAVIGGVYGATTDNVEDGEELLPVFVFGAAGAIIGTAAGAVTGLFRKKKVLIYTSQ